MAHICQAVALARRFQAASTVNLLSAVKAQQNTRKASQKVQPCQLLPPLLLLSVFLFSTAQKYYVASGNSSIKYPITVALSNISKIKQIVRTAEEPSDPCGRASCQDSLR